MWAEVPVLRARQRSASATTTPKTRRGSRRPSLIPVVSTWQWRGKRMAWPVRRGTARPVWRSGRGLDVPQHYLSSAEHTVHLRIEVWNEQGSSLNGFVGGATVPLQSLGKGGPASIPLNLNRSLLSRMVSLVSSRHAQCTAEVKVLSDPEPFRDIFFVRHGESAWNRAQAQLDVATMMLNLDHPLTEKGAQQALDLRSKVISRQAVPSRTGSGAPGTGSQGTGLLSDADRQGLLSLRLEYLHRLFLGVRTIWASPFTRAVCTALLGVEPLFHRRDSPSSGKDGGGGGGSGGEGDHGMPHPSGVATAAEAADQHQEQSQGPSGGGDQSRERKEICMKLAPMAREKRTFGGKDSSSCFSGGDLETHVMSAAATATQDRGVPGAAEVAARLPQLHLDVDECLGKWWSSSKESDAELDSRISELVLQLRYADPGPIIVVGHSFFIREYVRRFMDPELKRTSATAELVAKHKICNCGVLYCHMRLQPGNLVGIDDVEFLFDSTIEGGDASGEDRRAEDVARAISTAATTNTATVSGATAAGAPGTPTRISQKRRKPQATL